MSLLLSLIVTAAPLSCEQLWPAVWKAYAARELKGELPPFFRQFPNAIERIGQKWVIECKAFEAGALSCARAELLEAELVQLRKQLEREKTPPAEREALLERYRAQWSVLDCKAVDREIDRAAENVARELLDAGVPVRDDCAGDELASGRCRCAHRQCMSVCCREGEACAHSGADTAKCVKAR
ncbi:MAG: hypothetical protein JNJ54_19770 [Myxococcaceae bacterium]|nr:hypothetical protein [Myxococcaceae bacterium]